MITVTKERLGKDPWNHRDVYRIRVRADGKTHFKDFHVRIHFPRTQGLNFFFGNNADEVLVLQPRSKGLSRRDFGRRGATRRWRGTYGGWDVPGVGRVRGADAVDLHFLSHDCEDRSELTFDIAIDDLLRVEHWAATSNCRDRYAATDVVAQDDATEEREFSSTDAHGHTVTEKKRVSKLPDYEPSEESKNDERQAKAVLDGLFEEFPMETALAALALALSDRGYWMRIVQEPETVSQDDA